MPFGVRSVIGVVFMAVGIVSFGPIVPVLGIWMVPLGMALIGLDIPWTRHKVHDWMVLLEAKARAESRAKLPDA